MRQREESAFAEILNRLRKKDKKARLQDEDLKMLKKCIREGPEEALHIYPTRNEVNSYNNQMIMKLNSDVKIIEAEDYEKVKTSGKLIKKKVHFKSVEIGLPSSILLAEGARVMLVRNLDTLDGLVNGVMGTVTKILQSTSQSLPETVFVHFDSDKVGKNGKQKKKLLMERIALG